MMVKTGRIVYAFVPGHYEKIAIPSGPRPSLLSYIYFRNSKREKPMETLRKWRKYSQPWTFIIDSGLFTLQTQLKIGLSATSAVLTEMTKQEYEDFRKKNLEKESEIYEYTKEYGKFLREALDEDLFTIAIEMDVDNMFGTEYSDKYYEELLKYVPPEKIMRVWHQSGRDFSDWKKWCHDDSMNWLCIEGGVMHSRSVQFYTKFAVAAIENGKKIHGLALTIEDLVKNVPFTTVDSSTYINGGRYATIKVPDLGHISFSPHSTKAPNHYTHLKNEELKHCIEWFEENGYTLNDILKTGTEGHAIRSIMNLFYYDKYLDVPYEPKERSLSLL